MSRRKRQRRIGGATFPSLLRSNRLQFPNRQIALVESGLTCCKQTVGVPPNRQIFCGSAMFGFQISAPVSTQKDFQVEISVSHSKQGTRTRATRKYFRGSPTPSFEFRVWNFGLSRAQRLAYCQRVVRWTMMPPTQRGLAKVHPTMRGSVPSTGFCFTHRHTRRQTTSTRTKSDRMN